MKPSFYAVALAIAAAIGFAILSEGSSEGFLGAPPSSQYLDYLMFPALLNNQTIFEGTIYLDLARHASNWAWTSSLSGWMSRNGVTVTQQMVMLHFVESVVAVLGMLYLAYAMKRRSFVAFLSFGVLLLSGMTKLFQLKLLSSTFAWAIGYWVAALALQQHYLAAAVVAGAVGYVHPTYAPVYLGLVLLLQIVINRRSGEEHACGPCRTIFAFGLVALPFLINVLIHSEFLFVAGATSEAWFQFLRMVNKLPFPAERGVSYLFGHVLAFGFVAAVLWSTRRSNRDVNAGAALILVFCVVLFLLQTVFADLIRSPFVAKLALNHRILPLGLAVSVLGLCVVAYDRFWQRQGWSWLFVVGFFLFLQPTIYEQAETYSLFPGYLPRASYTRFDLLTPATVSLFLISLEGPIRPSGSRQSYLSPYGIGAIALACIGVGLIVFQEWPYILLLGAMAIGMISDRMPAGIWRVENSNYRSVVRALPGGAVVLPIAITTALAAVLLLNRLPIRDALYRWINIETVEAYKHTYIDEVAELVKPEERIFIVPLSGRGKELVTTPVRSTFLDGYEINYVLYLPHTLERVIQRLSVYAPDLAERLDERLDLMRYLDLTKGPLLKPDAWVWRAHIDEIQRLDPRVKWVITTPEYLCNGDREIVMEKGILIKLSDVVRDPQCVRRDVNDVG